MFQADRKLKADFIDYMTTHDGWPKDESFVKWVREHRDGIKSGTYGKMKEGAAVNPKHMVSFVDYFRRKAQHGGEIANVPFFDYLRSANLDLSQHSSETIADHLLEPTQFDAFQSGIAGLIFEIVNGKKVISKYVRSCDRDEERVRAAVRWMYATVARHSDPRGDALDPDTAIEMGAKRIGLPLDAYRERAMAWANFDSWTVVLARGKRVPVGMSIVLPLREHIYYALKAGQLCSYEIKPQDLCRPSRTLFIEGVGDRTVDLGGEPGNQSRTRLIAVACQIAILSHRKEATADEPLRCLTFAGTPTNQARLKSQGYKATGHSMPKTGVDLYEKVLDWPDPMKDIVLKGMLFMLGAHANMFLNPPSEDRG